MCIMPLCLNRPLKDRELIPYCNTELQCHSTLVDIVLSFYAGLPGARLHGCEWSDGEAWHVHNA